MLNEYIAEFKNPNADIDEVMNGNGGWQKIDYVRIEEDGSVTPFWYGHVTLSIYRSRYAEIENFEQMMEAN